jgi:hypothetical protein
MPVAVSTQWCKLPLVNYLKSGAKVLLFRFKTKMAFSWNLKICNNITLNTSFLFQYYLMFINDE